MARCNKTEEDKEIERWDWLESAYSDLAADPTRWDTVAKPFFVDVWGCLVTYATSPV